MCSAYVIIIESRIDINPYRCCLVSQMTVLMMQLVKFKALESIIETSLAGVSAFKTDWFLSSYCWMVEYSLIVQLDVRTLQSSLS